MPRLNLGLVQVNYYQGFSPFLNWWKTAGAPTLKRSPGGDLSGADIWSTGGYLSTDTGEIVNPAPADLTGIVRIFLQVPAANAAVGCDYEGEEFIAEWDNSATAQFWSAGTGASQSNDGSNRRLLTIGSDPAAIALQLDLTDANDPPQNIRLYQARYADEVAAGKKFNPDWLAEVRKFRSLRFMGWQPTNGSILQSVSGLATEAWHSWGQNEVAFGPKSDMPLSLIVELANETGVTPWVCIPHLADDALVQHFATTMKAGVAGVTRFEPTNEPWNFNPDFTQTIWLQTQGQAIWPDDGLRHVKYYGYLLARWSKIIRDVYNDTSRWEMVINTQTVSTGVTDAIIAGIDYWISENASSLTRADIAQCLAVTGYYGDVIGCTPISGITKANPAMVTAAGHGRSNDDDIKILVGVGMTELDDTYATVANKTDDTFQLSGVNSSGFTTFEADNRNYFLPAAIFRLMDQSESLFGSNPATYPTKYTYFNQQLAQSVKTGSCDFGFDTDVSVASLRDTYWPAQKAKADANGWRLVQYEGNLHFVGDSYLNGFGGQAQFTEFLVQFGHCVENADALAAMYQAWVTLVGDEASKFVEAGISSQFGTWAGIRFWPLTANEDTDDTGNPVWQATLRANAGKRAITLT